MVETKRLVEELEWCATADEYASGDLWTAYHNRVTVSELPKSKKQSHNRLIVQQPIATSHDSLTKIYARATRIIAMCEANASKKRGTIFRGGSEFSLLEAARLWKTASGGETGSEPSHQSTGHLCTWLSGAMGRLDAFANLSEDWDGYNAAPSKPDVLTAAASFIREVAVFRIKAPTVNPTRNGGVLLTWRDDSHHLEVNFVSRDVANVVYLNTKTNESWRSESSSRCPDAKTVALLKSHFAK